MNEVPRFCEHCGAPLQADARFCEECGQPVSWEPEQQAANLPQQQGYDPGAAPSGPGPAISREMMLAGVVGVAALVGLIFVIFVVLGGGDDAKPSSSVPQVTEEFGTFASETQPPSVATQPPVAATEPSGTAPAGWSVALRDTFDSNVNGWPTGDFDDGSAASRSRALVGGVYSLSLQAEQGWLAPELVAVNAGSAFHLAVDTTSREAGREAVCGLMLAGAGTYPRIALLLSVEEGGYRVYRATAQGAASETLVDLTPSAAIRSVGANRLAVLAEGSRLVLFINGERVGDIADAQIENLEQAGVVAGTWDSSGAAACEFDNFELRVP